MITWIQKTFHGHFRLVFIALLVASIVSFIFVNNASFGFGLFQPRKLKRPFFGVNLADTGAVERIQKDASVSVFFQFGGIPPKTEHLQKLAFKRHALVHTAARMRLPHPPPDEVEKHIKTLRFFQDGQGGFDAAKYAWFCASPKAGTGLDMTLGDFMRVIGDDLRIDHLQKLISGPGYVLPEEIRQVLKQNETTWTLVSAQVDFKDALPESPPAEDRLKQFFEKNRSSYTIAPQVRVDYIEFSASLFLDSVTVTAEEVRAYYDANPARFPKSLAVANSPQSRDQHYELVRANAEALLRQQRANSLAAGSASDFALALHNDNILPGARKFGELLEKNNVSIKPLPAFSKDTPPAQFGKHAVAVAREGFALNAETRYSNPVATGQGAVILVWRESIPGRPAEFSEVAGKIKDDYINGERRGRILAAEKRIKHKVESDLNAGLPFQVAITKAAAGEGVQVTTKNHAPFTLRQHDAGRRDSPGAGGIDRDLIAMLRDLEQGRMSDMVINGSTGRFVYAQQVKYSDLTASNPEYARIERTLSERNARAAFDAYVSHLVDTELEKADRVEETGYARPD